MRRNVLLLLLLVLTIIETASAQDDYYVRVRSTKLRSAPQHFAPAVTELKLGAAVRGSEAADGWYKVQTPNKKSGYLHKSTLSDKRIVSDIAKQYNPSTDSSDIVLAGKGFNKEVEKEYAAQNPSLNFKQVDAMDRISIKDAELVSFIKAGGLRNNG